ncbi:hypothetical protein [Candidatus Nitrotoga arctica]|uniref:Uncharacterized protein n=1 Tax=Candidatus Nitrotoga arctica TaxID=453162 RepID=A0ABM8Z0I7_9PROT|nr:hypothetical protein [Candidatus Nitrotoga arctica]CAG9933372.1 conserved protein of unknown function [Candidatus Nitrotoga arctica]
MKKTNEIILQLQSVDQMLMLPESPFYPNRMLSPDAEEFLAEEAATQPYHARVYLKVHLPSEAANRAHEIESAIHKHFAYLKNKSERKLKQTLQLGWRSLLISIVFLSLLISLATFAAQLLPEGGLSITFREALVILGWVALWRPADLLLYEWRPFKREVNLFSRLEQCKVEIII